MDAVLFLTDDLHGICGVWGAFAGREDCMFSVTSGT
jgi:hypothetical protein